MALIAMELHRLNYTEDQARKAEGWILYGDWKYRGTSPTLDFTDFFPTAEQTQTVADRFADTVVVVERSRIRALQESAYRQGHADGIQAERQRAQERQGIAELETAWRSAHD